MIKTFARLGVLTTLVTASLASTVFTSFTAVAAQAVTKTASIQKTGASQLKPYIARYKLFRSGTEHGTAERELSALDSLYRLSYKSSIKWLIFSDKRSESSEFKIEDQQVKPYSYTMERSGTGPDRHYKVTFDREQQLLVTGKKKRKNKKNSAEQPDWDENWLDPISYQQQLYLDLKQGKKTFDYFFINRKGLQREYKFKVAGEELLTLPYGNIKAIKVERVYDENSERQTFAWFAPELDYTLVRIWKAKSGTEQFDIQLTELVL